MAQALGGHMVGTQEEQEAVAELEQLLLDARAVGLLGDSVLAWNRQVHTATLLPAQRLLAKAAPLLRIFTPPPLAPAGVSLLGRSGTPSSAARCITVADVPTELGAQLAAAGAALQDAAEQEGGGGVMRVQTEGMTTLRRRLPRQPDSAPHVMLTFGLTEEQGNLPRGGLEGRRFALPL